ncbi:MAG: MurR/RpiR family transcriptional regulator [Lachnospiraceae bacterium]|nr:MurR/RpiR family transcriptional regulator [Lachnospiraceae bacterium]MDD3614707.1 MurR/RpiR family transcriptional regulator [Lachnospiraceae bacterium]
MISFEIKKEYASLRKSEQKVADFVLEHLGEVASMSMIEIAERVNVSQPTIARFAKAVGYDSYKKLKVAIIKESGNELSATDERSPLHGYQLGSEDRMEDIPAKVVSTTINALEEALKGVSGKVLKDVVNLITKADNVVVYGVENSSSTVSDLVTKLMYLGINCRSYEDYYLQSISAGNLTSQDLAIGVSYSGCSTNTVDVMKLAKKAGAKTIVLTNFEHAPISEYADITICTSSEQFLYGDAIFSRTVQLAIVDMIYMGVLTSDYRKYTKKMDKSSKIIRNRAYNQS